MVSLDAVRTANSTLKDRLGSGAVAVFVGGTSGIGEHTLRAFVKHTDSASVYIVGRNEEAASKILSELKAQNPSHKLSFIKSDVSLLRNVDTACKEIAEKEKKVNFLFLSPGILAMRGRDDTAEHIPRKLALHYYSRFRFVSQLQPLLTAPSSDPQLPTRVLTVLGAGYEDKLDTYDLALEKNYSLRSCAAHAITLSSLSISHLAQQNPSISFIHSNPGGVKTNIGSDSGWLFNVSKGVGFALLGFIGIVSSAEESGERHLWALTDPKFAPAAEKASSAPEGVGRINGNGAYLIGTTGEKTGNYKILDPLLKDGWATRAWQQSVEFMDRVVKADSAK